MLVTILRTPSLRSPSKILLCSLAVSDIFVGFVVQLLYIAKEFITDDVSLFRILEFMAFALCGVSLMTITVISLDRFAALQYNLKYSSLVTTRRVALTSGIMWLGCFMSSTLYFWNRTNYLIISSVLICMCLLISFISYIRISRIVQHHQLQIHIQQQAVQSSQSGSVNLNMARLKRSAVNSFIFNICIVLFYLPKLISLTVSVISNKHWTNSWNLADTVVFMNSSINPIMYCWRLRELRTAVAKIARQMVCRKIE